MVSEDGDIQPTAFGWKGLNTFYTKQDDVTRKRRVEDEDELSATHKRQKTELYYCIILC